MQGPARALFQQPTRLLWRLRPESDRLRVMQDNEMRLLCLSDIHGDRLALKRILARAKAADAILLAGDLTNFGTPNGAERIVRMAQDYCDTVLAVAGNCDSAAIDARLTRLGVSLFQRGVAVGTVGFYGLSAMPPWLSGMYALTDEQSTAALQAGRRQLPDVHNEVIVSHPPPYGTSVDCTHSGQHVGSQALMEFVWEHEPALVVCGHIHEAVGIDQIGFTTVVNCGQAARGQFAIAEIAAEVRVELMQV